MLSFNVLKKNLKKDHSGLKEIRIAILSDTASQFLNTGLKGYGFEAGINFNIYEADYNQIDMQVLDTSSELYEFKPDFIFINCTTEKLLKDFYKKNRQQQDDYADTIAQKIKQYYDTIASRLRSRVIINTFPEINDSIFGNYAAKTRSSLVYQVRRTNLLLMELSQQVKDMYICDLASLQSDLGYRFLFDPKMYVNADMAYSIDFVPYIAKHITDIILSISGTFKKCLILDLDNTTWGGIIGDDGMEGIQVGYFGAGKIYTEIQLWAKQLKQRGIILAVCSKNTESIAKEPFESHPDMVLRMEDIAIFVANWETKVDNIRYIQSILNISFDSMVFVDDNPFEREMVKAGIPDLTVPDLPVDPAEYLIYLRSLNLFETASFTGEDEHRTKQYQEEANRTILQQSFENEHDFLASLQMIADVKAFDTFTIPRVAQLTQRSNQFNLRTVRYTEEDIKHISADADYYTISLSLADKFGDHGLIGIVILHKAQEDTLFIDSWIMSCRVLKRGMEQFTLNMITELALAHGFRYIAGEYLPTKKNGIVMDHYKSLGFEPQEDKWILDVNKSEKRDTFITAKNTPWNSTK